MGIALGPGAYQTPGELLRAADTALYAAKQGGKAQVVQLGTGSDYGATLAPPDDAPQAAA